MPQSHEELLTKKRAYRAANKEAIAAYNRSHKAANKNIIRHKSRAYRTAHKEELLPRQRAYKAAHKEELRVKRLVYVAAHKEEIAAKSRAYNAAHKEAIAARNRVYKSLHKEEIRLQKRAYGAAHPAINAAMCARRRAREAGASVSDLTAAQWEEIKAAYGHRCVYCRRKMQRLTKDHIVPLVNGGTHTFSNVVPACRSCNSKKGTGAPLVPVQPLLLTIAASQAGSRASNASTRAANSLHAPISHGTSFE